MQENHPLLSLPGIQFAPTDVEMIRDYLMNKNLGRSLPCDIIQEVDLSQFNPDQLTGYSIHGIGVMYFFTRWKPTCKNGTRSSRQAGDGFWKATVGSTAVIDKGHILGYKRALKFYKGTTQEGEKTPWLMDEYRINKVDHDNKTTMWFLCRIHMNRQVTKKKWANGSLKHHDAEMDQPSNRCTAFQAFPAENSTKLIPTPSTWNQSLALPWSCIRTSSEVDNYEAQLAETCHDNAVQAPLEIDYGNWLCDGSHFIEEESPVAVTPEVISNFEAVMNSIAARSFDNNLATANCSTSFS